MESIAIAYATIGVVLKVCWVNLLNVLPVVRTSIKMITVALRPASILLQPMTGLPLTIWYRTMTNTTWRMGRTTTMGRITTAHGTVVLRDQPRIRKYWLYAPGKNAIC